MRSRDRRSKAGASREELGGEEAGSGRPGGEGGAGTLDRPEMGLCVIGALWGLPEVVLYHFIASYDLKTDRVGAETLSQQNKFYFS